MVDLPETPTWTPVVRLELNTPVRGGATGESNAPLSDLTDRTAYLKEHVDEIEAALPLLAPIASPDFTGTPQSITPPAGDESRRIVTTEWVFALLRGVTTKAVSSGVVALTATEAGRGILIFTGTLTGAVTVTIPAAQPGRWVLVNRTSGGHALGVRNNGSALAALDILPGGSIAVWSDGTDLRAQDTESTDHTLRGAPTASAPAPTSNDSRVATTAWARAFARGATTLTATAGATLTLTDAQANAPVILIAGSPTATFTVVFPGEPGRWTVRNATGQRADLRVTGQVTPLALAAGRTQSVMTDGATLRPAITEVRDLDLPGTPTSDTPPAGAVARETVNAEWVRALLAGQALYTTGDFKMTFKIAPDPGWLFLDGRTIGAAGSGATARAHADTADLYALLWASLPDAAAPVIGGRGASAAADFAALKPLTLPDARGRAFVGAGAGAGLTNRTIGSRFGAETVTLSVSEMPEHGHGGTTAAGGGHAHTATITPAGAHSHTATIAEGGWHGHTGWTDPQGEHQHQQGSEALYADYGGGNLIGDDRSYVVGGALGFGLFPSWRGQNTSPNGTHQHGVATHGAGNHIHGATVAAAGEHSHTATVDAAAPHQHAIPNQGGQQPHDNMPPSLAVNVMVKL